jgi:malate permease and related proteins
MNEALQKSLTLIFLILIGLFLKSKFKNKEMTNGLKELVLTVALPSTIFIALMKIPLDSTLVLVPVITIVFNFNAVLNRIKIRQKALYCLLCDDFKSD